MQKGGKKKTAWMQHVTKTMEQMPNVALKDVLKAASKTYKKGKAVTGAARPAARPAARRVAVCAAAAAAAVKQHSWIAASPFSSIVSAFDIYLQ